jgi:hypothetical protein
MKNNMGFLFILFQSLLFQFSSIELIQLYWILLAEKIIYEEKFFFWIFEPLRWHRYFVPKRGLGITDTRCVITQNSAVLEFRYIRL